MKLVIEREGGFTIVEDADAITEIDVRSYGVKLTLEVGGDKWTVDLPVSSHAEACRVSAAIAIKCGELVEPLAKGPETVTASLWVEGEPPRDGRFHVVAVAENVAPCLARWDGTRWHDGDGATFECPLLAHLPSPVPWYGRAI